MAGKKMSSNKRIVMWCALILPPVILLANIIDTRFGQPGSSGALQAAPQSAARAPERPPSKDDLALDACMHAQRAVRAVLKAPSMAKFPGCGWSAHLYDIRAAPDLGTWWVEGYVDSQNSFGAMLRTQFIVKLARAGERWEVMNVAAE